MKLSPQVKKSRMGERKKPERLAQGTKGDLRDLLLNFGPAAGATVGRLWKADMII